MRYDFVQTYAMVVDLAKHMRTTMKYKQVEKNLLVQWGDRASREEICANLTVLWRRVTAENDGKLEFKTREALKNT